MLHPFDDALAAITGVDLVAMAEAREHHGRLTKPAGSLGELEHAGRPAGRHCPCEPAPDPPTGHGGGVRR